MLRVMVAPRRNCFGSIDLPAGIIERVITRDGLSDITPIRFDGSNFVGERWNGAIGPGKNISNFLIPYASAVAELGEVAVKRAIEIQAAG